MKLPRPKHRTEANLTALIHLLPFVFSLVAGLVFMVLNLFDYSGFNG